MKKTASVLSAIAALMLALATAKLPYDFYSMLRFVVTLASILVAIAAVQTRRIYLLLVALPALVLWFPTASITMNRAAWLPLDLGFAAAFVVTAILLMRSKS